MTTGFLRLRQSGALAVTLTFSCGMASAEQLYRLTDLGTLGGTYSYISKINDAGQATGITVTADTQDGQVPFLWNGGAMQRIGTAADAFDYGYAGAMAINDAGQVTGFFQDKDIIFPTTAFRADKTTFENLGSLAGSDTVPRAINNSGHVVGESRNANGRYRAFFWNGSTMKNLGTFGGTESFASDINALGQVTGAARTTNNDAEHAFLWNGTTMRDLGTLGGTRSYGDLIDSSGRVAGTSQTSGNRGSHVFFWNGTRMIDVGTLGGSSSELGEMNAANQITGRSDTAAGGGGHAFLWENGTMLDLGVPGGGTHSWGRAIDESGQVTGDYGPAGDGTLHAFLWNGSTMKDLNALVDPSDPLKQFVKLNGGLDINKRGQIAANGHDSRLNQDHAYVVTPLQYQIELIEPAANSKWKLGTSVPIKIALAKANGQRISDARAANLVATPCKVKFSAAGAQDKAASCMKYDATANVFYFTWKLGTTGTGATTLKTAATYKYSMPETITTTKTRPVAIIQ